MGVICKKKNYKCSQIPNNCIYKYDVHLFKIKELCFLLFYYYE